MRKFRLGWDSRANGQNRILLRGRLASSEKLQGVLFADFSSAAGNEWSDNMTGGAAVDQNGNMIGILGERKKMRVKIFHRASQSSSICDRSIFAGKERSKRANLGVYYVALSKENGLSWRETILIEGRLYIHPADSRVWRCIVGKSGGQSGNQDRGYYFERERRRSESGSEFGVFDFEISSREIQVTLKIIRDGKEMEVKVAIELILKVMILTFRIDIIVKI